MSLSVFKNIYLTRSDINMKIKNKYNLYLCNLVIDLKLMCELN